MVHGADNIFESLDQEQKTLWIVAYYFCHLERLFDHLSAIAANEHGHQDLLLVMLHPIPQFELMCRNNACWSFAQS